MPELAVERLGTVPYAEALELQLRYQEERRRGEGRDRLLLLEHPPVLTLGRSAGEEHLLTPRAELRARGIEVHRVSRGGDVTYHGPGQLVGYLVLDLAARGEADVHAFLRRISIGVGLRGWVSYHGFALNATSDLAGFRDIVPCGLRHVEMSSVAAELARPESADGALFASVREAVAEAFVRGFAASGR